MSTTITRSRAGRSTACTDTYSTDTHSTDTHSTDTHGTAANGAAASADRPQPGRLRELVVAARAGCPEAEAELFRVHHRLLFGIARNYGLDEHDCADVAQRTWLKARQGLPGLRQDDRFKQWISAIARNESFKTIRSRNRETSLPTDQMEGTVEWDPDSTLIRFEDLQMMRAAVNRLEPGDQNLVRLLFQEGKSYRQVAEELGCPPGCVGPNRGRMLSRLRRLMFEQDRPQSLAG